MLLETTVLRVSCRFFGGGGGGGPFMRGCDSLKLQSDFVENVLLRAYSPVGLLRVCDF